MSWAHRHITPRNIPRMPPRISVIFSTYNSTEWLRKTLWGFACQRHPSFEVVVADDGSGDETRQVIEDAKSWLGHPLIHVWHEDRGFQKSAILNKAVVAATGDYLIFTDGDCIPRSDFVGVHAALAQPGKMLSGGYVKLPLDVSRIITEDDIRAGRATDAQWLRSQGMRASRSLWKLQAHGIAARILNRLTPTKATWNGHNASGWKSNIVSVNGFDERMQYGGQDRELGERMMNAGISPVQIRFSAVCVHLEHGRGYRTEESIARNRGIRRETVTLRLAWTEHGILKGPPPSSTSNR